MKRDMDLVRKILFAMEDDEKHIEFTEDSPVKVEGYKRQTVSYHMKIMAQAGLLHIDLFESLSPIMEGFQMPKITTAAYSISWAGHEFLAAASNDSFWKRAKLDFEKVVGGTGRLMLPVLTQILTSYIKAGLNLP